MSFYNQKHISSSGKLGGNRDINGTWDAVRENITISAKESIGCRESKHHKPSFDEECSTLVD
jgi:hypothetical protein